MSAKTLAVPNSILMMLVAITAILTVTITPFLPLALAGTLGFALLYFLPFDFYILSFILGLLLTSSVMDERVRTAIIIGGSGYFILHIWYFTQLKDKPLAKVPAKLVAFILFITLSTFISTVYSLRPSMGMGALFRQTVFFVIAYFCFAAIKSSKQVFIYLAAIAISGFAVGFGTISNVVEYGIEGVISAKGVMRFSAIYDNVNAAGGIIALAMGIIIIFYYTTYNNKKFYTKVLFAFVFGIMALGLLMTDSRASFLGVFVSSISILFFMNPTAIKKVFAAVIGIVALVLILPLTRSLLILYLRVEKLFNLRDVLWQISIDSYKESPIFGIGPDMLKDYFYKYLPLQLGSWNESKIRYLYEVGGTSGLSHNFIIFRLTELGIPGLISAFWLPGLYFYFARKAIINASGRHYNFTIVAKGLTGLGFGIFARSFFESIGQITYGWIMIDLPFWLCLASLVFIAQYPTEKLTESV